MSLQKKVVAYTYDLPLPQALSNEATAALQPQPSIAIFVEPFEEFLSSGSDASDLLSSFLLSKRKRSSLDLLEMPTTIYPKKARQPERQ